MDKERKDGSFIKKPIYPGGNEAMRQFVKQNLKYPKEAVEKKIEGYVALKYEINYKGVVTKAKVISGLGHGCDEEAKRLVKLFKFQVPKNPRKLKVKFNRNIKIHFKLRKNPTTKPTTGYSITYTKPNEPTVSKTGNSYNYIININH